MKMTLEEVVLLAGAGAVAGVAGHLIMRPKASTNLLLASQEGYDNTHFKFGLGAAVGGVLVSALAPRGEMGAVAMIVAGAGAGVAATSFIQRRKA